jgi:hypothetical protein
MSSQTETSAGTRKGGRKGIIIVIIIACVVVAVLAGVIIYLLSTRDQGQDEEKEMRNVVVSQDNLQEQIGNMDSMDYVEPGYYTASMTNEWHFASGDAVSQDAYVANRPENTNDVYFDLFLAGDESKPIYESPVIPRGSSLEQISLDVDLDPGTYDTVMIYHLIDENQNTISTLRVTVTLYIEG